MHNFILPRYPLLGVQEVTDSASQTGAIRRLNERLVQAAGSLPGVYVLDCERLAADVGYQHWQDSKMWYLARAAFSAPALRAVAQAQAVFVRIVMAAPRKCLVVDLDNTLWGGVIGELGVAGIQLGHTYPGNVFREFQRTLLRLYRRGVLLAINSKNNLSDVEDVFRTHPDMLLKWEHFASIQANWRPKPDNMLAIARELSIGIDSIVFVDDDAAECALMREVLPDVLTLDQTPDPLARMAALMSCAAFDKVRLTDEDRRRGELYRTQAQRDHLKNASHSVEGFLRSLEMEITIRPVDEFSLPRVVDLIQKTNQFNLTTRRYSSAELAAMLADDEHVAFSLRVADRFGDNGIVGVALVQYDGAQAHLDSFLLSCRVIGRTIETAFLAFLIDWAGARGISTLEGQFIATAKNAPAADFYARHGFTRTPGNDPATHWTLPVHNAPVRWPAYIRQAEEMRQAS
jgi:FkbH-like protein